MFQVSRESPESFGQNVRRTSEAPGRGTAGRARNKQHRWELTRHSWRDVSQSGDSPGGAGSERKPGEKHETETHCTRHANVLFLSHYTSHLELGKAIYKSSAGQAARMREGLWRITLDLEVIRGCAESCSEQVQIEAFLSRKLEKMSEK